MKKTISVFGFILLVTALFFAACSKSSDVNAPTKGTLEKTVPQATINSKSSSSATLGDEEPAGTLEISEDLFGKLMDGSLIQSESTVEHTYTALRPVIPPDTSNPPIDPCVKEWFQFQIWYNNNIAQMKAWANAHCLPYLGCWAGKCVCIAYAVPPDPKLCIKKIAYTPTLKVFEVIEATNP